MTNFISLIGNYFLKLKPIHFTIIAGTSGCLLFLPQKTLEIFGVLQFAQDKRPILGMTFIFSILYVIINATTMLWGKYRIRSAQLNVERGILKRLNCLTEDEKQILRFYIFQQTKSNILRFDDGTVNGLESDGIIFQSSVIGDIHNGVAYNISNIAWNYLNKNNKLLIGTTTVMRTDKHRVPYSFAEILEKSIKTRN